MSVLVATAYMEEAERFDWLVAMDAGTRAGHRHAGGAACAHRQRDAGSGLHRPAARGRAARPSAP